MNTGGQWQSMCQCSYHCRACQIAPSLLASDLAAIGSEAKAVLAAGADSLHLDIMDGNFVPNISWGPPVVQCLRKAVGDEPFLDCHMMVTNPMQWIQPIKESGGNQYTFHIEACTINTFEEICKAIVATGMKVGIALKPGTDCSEIAHCISLVDMVLVMTVEPGFGGQSFMPNMMPKVLQLRTENPDMDIQVDGGLSPATIDAAAKAGANSIVAGSACFKPGVPANGAITTMRRSVEKHGNGKDEAAAGYGEDGMAMPMAAAA